MNIGKETKFIEVAFSGSNSPYSAYGKYYQRFADEDKQISDSTGFKFVFYRPLGHQNVQEMTKSEKAVYEHLKECDYLTVAQLAIKIGKSEKTVYRAIKGLKENGYVEREGNDANGYWKILR